MQAAKQHSSSKSPQFVEDGKGGLDEKRDTSRCRRRRERKGQTKQVSDTGVSEPHTGLGRWSGPLPGMQPSDAIHVTDCYPGLSRTTVSDITSPAQSALMERVSVPVSNQIRSLLQTAGFVDDCGDKFESDSVLAHGNQWPSLVNCRPSIPADCMPRQQRASGAQNVGGMGKRTASTMEKSAKETEDVAARARPVAMMISTDFIVSAPVRENLLLTIALRQHERREEEEGASESKGKVFLGYFSTKFPFSRFVLGYDATRVACEPNAGGQSVVSESLSVEYFSRRFGASNVVTEMEVAYENAHWKKVDYICDIYGQRVGVSVTRAMSYPDPHQFSEEKAKGLLYKKLYGLVVARSGVSARHSFVKALLHVWCETERTAMLMQREYADMAKELEVEEDVIMVLTVAEGGEAKPIFYEQCLRGAAECGNKEWGYWRKQHPWWGLTRKHHRKS